MEYVPDKKLKARFGLFLVFAFLYTLSFCYQGAVSATFQALRHQSPQVGGRIVKKRTFHNFQ